MRITTSDAEEMENSEKVEANQVVIVSIRIKP